MFGFRILDFGAEWILDFLHRFWMLKPTRAGGFSSQTELQGLDTHTHTQYSFPRLFYMQVAGLVQT